MRKLNDKTGFGVESPGFRTEQDLRAEIERLTRENQTLRGQVRKLLNALRGRSKPKVLH